MVGKVSTTSSPQGPVPRVSGADGWAEWHTRFKAASSRYGKRPLDAWDPYGPKESKRGGNFEDLSDLAFVDAHLHTLYR